LVKGEGAENVGTEMDVTLGMTIASLTCGLVAQLRAQVCKHFPFESFHATTLSR
jgi:hypothetical protein